MKQPEGDLRDIIPVAEADVQAPEYGLIGRTWKAIKRTFYSLKFSDFRLLWFGGWFSNVGSWIQQVATGWLVYKLTNSSVSLGIVNFSSTIPVFFLSFYAGTVADRFSKKWIVFWGNFFPMLFAFLLGYLVSTDRTSVPSLVFLSLGSGVAMAFAFPAWQSFISEIVPKKDLMNAIALNSVQFHASRLVGPALAGILVSELGLDWAFYANGISFLAVLGSLLAVKDTQKTPRTENGWLVEAKEGFSYLMQRQNIFIYMLNVALIGIFGISFLGTLMPIFAGNVLKVNAKEFGTLMAANGFGGLIGALFVAWMAGRMQPLSILRFSVPLSGISLVIIGLTSSYILSLVFLFLAGVFFLASNSTLNTVIQASVDRHFRGRIMSIFVWMFMGLAPFGSLLSGYLGKIFGVEKAISLGGFTILIVGYLLLKVSRTIKINK